MGDAILYLYVKICVRLPAVDTDITCMRDFQYRDALHLL